MAWTGSTTRSGGQRVSPRQRRIAGIAALAMTTGAAFAVATGTGQAAENCQGLDTALRDNLTFIAGQRQNPDANSAARIANRQAVVDLLQQRRATAGCADEVRVAGAVCPAVPWDVAVADRLDAAWTATEQMGREQAGRMDDPQLTAARVQRVGGIVGQLGGIVRDAAQARRAARDTAGAAQGPGAAQDPGAAQGGAAAAPGGGQGAGGVGRAAAIVGQVGGLIQQIAGIVQAARAAREAAQGAEAGQEAGTGQEAEGDQEAGDGQEAEGDQEAGGGGEQDAVAQRVAARLQQVRALIQQIRAIVQEARQARRAAAQQDADAAAPGAVLVADRSPAGCLATAEAGAVVDGARVDGAGRVAESGGSGRNRQGGQGERQGQDGQSGQGRDGSSGARSGD